MDYIPEYNNTASEQPEKINGVLMCINIKETGIADMRNKEDAIIQLGKVLSAIGSVIYRSDGRIVDISETNITAIFDSGGENAVKAAVTICQSVISILGRCSVSIGIGTGLLCMTKLCYNDFNSVVVLSEIKRFVKTLSVIASEYNSHILITEITADSIPNFKSRYNARRLGMVKLSSRDMNTYIYDIYDGDTQELKYSKRRSRLFFETGVEQFYLRNYLQARSYFIELLKFDANDKAAKKYIKMCDAFLSDSTLQEENRYIEIL